MNVYRSYYINTNNILDILGNDLLTLSISFLSNAEYNKIFPLSKSFNKLMLNNLQLYNGYVVTLYTYLNPTYYELKHKSKQVLVGSRSNTYIKTKVKSMSFPFNKMKSWQLRESTEYFIPKTKDRNSRNTRSIELRKSQRADPT